MTPTNQNLRTELSEILVKWDMPTRQVAINNIVQLVATTLDDLQASLPEKYPDPDAKYLGLKLPYEVIDWETLTAQRAYNEALDRVTETINTFKRERL